VLWILYLMAAGRAGLAHQWGIGEYLGAGLASVLPGGPFVFDAWVTRKYGLTTEAQRHREDYQEKTEIESDHLS
jgi:hypothetical protein